MRRVHRLITLLLLLAYAGTGTSVFPAIVLFVAEIDGSHAVSVTHSKQGTQVRLHHRDEDFTPEVEDHCSPLTRMIVCCFRPSSEGDHSLSTQAMSDSLLVSRDEGKRDVKDTPEINSQATVQLVLGLPRPADSDEAPRRPMPLTSGHQMTAQRRAMASVRLLI